MNYDASWLVLVGILPLTFYVASMRERMKLFERKLDVALSEYAILRNYLMVRDPRFFDGELIEDATGTNPGSNTPAA